MNNIKDKIVRVLPWLILACALVYTIGMYALYGPCGLDSDISSEMVLAELLNEEGRLMGFQHNLRFLGVDLVGTIVVAGVDGEDFCDLKAEDAALVMKSMGLTQKKPGGDAKAGKSAEVMWLCCTGDRPVGLVKAWDGYEGQWKYYIGTGYGLDLDEDVECIMALGQRYYDLSFIQDFCREPKRSGSGVLPGQMDIEEFLEAEHEQQ